MAFALDIVQPGEGAANRYLFNDGSYVIGRGPSCHICLNDPGVSERHALLLLSDATATIQDMHSANGTLVNGTPIGDIVELSPETVVQLGGTVLRAFPVSDEEAAEMQRTAEKFRSLTEIHRITRIIIIRSVKLRHRRSVRRDPIRLIGKSMVFLCCILSRAIPILRLCRRHSTKEKRNRSKYADF
jgi:pSer/pThr/pTyr-binding forkhead associated (FHA) protein